MCHISTTIGRNKPHFYLIFPNKTTSVAPDAPEQIQPHLETVSWKLQFSCPEWGKMSITAGYRHFALSERKNRNFHATLSSFTLFDIENEVNEV